jgi:hypothetical protein
MAFVQYSVLESIPSANEFQTDIAAVMREPGPLNL